MKKRIFSLLLCAALALSLLPAGALAAPDTEPVPDAPAGVSVRVQAVDAASGLPLTNFNAKIEILDAGNQESHEHEISDEIMEIQGLTPGSYTLRVTGTPKGLTAPGDVSFTVGGDGVITAAEGTVTEDGVLLVPFAVLHMEHGGEDNWGDSHPGWTAWSSRYSLPDPDAPGNYYLTEDIDLVDPWTVPPGVVNLCLNGHSIASVSEGRIIVPDGAVLNLYDESGSSGKITGYSDSFGSFVTVKDGGTFTMNGGSITGNTVGNIVWVASGGAFTMNGGAITDNTANNVVLDNGAFTMNGGSITGNTGAGVYMQGTDTFRVSGSPVVTGNQESDAPRNVVLAENWKEIMPVIQIAGPLTVDARLGVSLVPAYDTISYPAVFTYGLDAKGQEPNGSAENFLSDDGAYLVRVNEAGEAELFSAPPEVSVRVQAVDAASGLPLTNFNASIEILDAGNQESHKHSISDEIVEIQRLTPGSYTLQVTETPEGFTVPEDIPFTVGGDGVVTAAGATVTEDGVLLVPFALRHMEHEGEDTGEGSHPGWTGWNDSKSLPDAPGNYYLTGDIDFSNNCTVSPGVFNLCLNGHSITSDGEGRIIVPDGAALNLYDESRSSGKITGYSDSGESFVTVEDGGAFTMNGGSIAGNTGDNIVWVTPGGAFTMNGGSITHNSVNQSVVWDIGAFTMNGGAITGNTANKVVYDSGAFTMNGGAVTGNTGAGVYMEGAVTFRVSGSPVVTGNQGTGAARNVVLAENWKEIMPVIQIDGPLTGDAKLGVTVRPAPTADDPAVFTAGLDAKGQEPNGSAANFSSDDGAYQVRVNEAGEAELFSAPPGGWPPQPEPGGSGGRSTPARQGVQQTLPTAEPAAPEPEPEPVKTGCPKDDTCPISQFTDAGPDAWYHDGVHWALETGVMKGVSGDAFDPGGTVTRAMAVTMLWRLAGEPAGSPSPFADVASGSWYENAVNWAAETGAVNGTSGTAFSPGEPITREQLAAVLYRYAQAQGKGFTGAWAFPLNFSDAADVSEWADEAMHWMVMNGILTGRDDGTLSPKDSASRAEIATMFLRFHSEMEK